MSLSSPARQPRGIPTGGQFAPDLHAEASVSLEPRPRADAGMVVSQILAELKTNVYASATKLRWDANQRLQGGDTAEDILADWLAQGRNGRCEHHADLPEDRHPEDQCPECTIHVMADARINPRPAPVPLGPPPGRPSKPHLEKGASTVTEEGESSSVTATPLTGDQQLEASVRRMFGAPADAAVAIVQEDFEDWSTYTGEFSSTLEVSCGGQKRSFEGLGDLVRELARTDQPEPVRMALRFMRAVDAERPLLQGTAAVWMDQGPYAEPKPVFGRVINCFLHGRDQFMEFAHADGRHEYIYFSRVVAIQETDQSSVYPEGQTRGPAAAAGPAPHTDRA